ncbi:hypothetical protein ANN_11140 [Periplaneta americana]|uniref:RNase H type-1 domain-containing protein n=1 Tax=Periplaneta americana TaxID=6978 RepID=A0ABQ8T5L3_PERAM|nr:hypothetical protein ANN_11140 [Periplaneta americana]
MAIDWIISQRKDKTSYGIHVDSQAALHALANKRTTQPIAVYSYIRKKMIELKKTTEISLIWIKGHSGIKGNERADYLAKIAARYSNIIEYNSIPLSLSKQLIQNYYINIWNATHTQRIKKSQSPLCICPEKTPQTAIIHLLTECTHFSTDRPYNTVEAKSAPDDEDTHKHSKSDKFHQQNILFSSRIAYEI